MEQIVSRLTVSRGTNKTKKQDSVNLGFIGSSRFSLHTFALVVCSFPVSRGTFDRFNPVLFHVEHYFSPSYLESF